MSGLRRFLVSAVLAAASTAGFMAAVGAAKDGLLVLLFGGFLDRDLCLRGVCWLEPTLGSCRLYEGAIC